MAWSVSNIGDSLRAYYTIFSYNTDKVIKATLTAEYSRIFKLSDDGLCQFFLHLMYTHIFL